MEDQLTIIISAFAGALGSGIAGWWDSHEKFELRKFMGTVWRAIFSAAVATSVSQYVNIEGAVWLYGFLAGAAGDGIGNKVQGGVSGKS